MVESATQLCLDTEAPASAEATAAPVRNDPTGVAALTARLVGGDEVAWRTFHEAYFPRLLRYLLVVTGGREEAAREALQLTFVRAVRHVRRFDSEPALWSWLTVLARSAVVDEHRKHHRYLAFLDRFLRWRQTAPPADNHDADARLREFLAVSLAGLSDDDRDLVERKYLEGGSVRELAAALGETEKAVEARLGRIRRKLKDAILAQLKHET